MMDDLFKRLPASAFQVQHLVKDDVLFRQDQPTAGFFRVLSGAVILRRTTTSGDDLILHRATARQTFAEASIYSPSYHCDAICSATGKVQKIAKTPWLAALQSDPQFAAGFNRALAIQTQTYRQLVEILGIRSAAPRVHAAIKAGYLDGTITEFAARIHLTHEACYRALKSLTNAGVLIKSGRGCYGLCLTSASHR